MFKFVAFLCLVASTYASTASLKPLSACCDIPDLGNPKLASDCSKTQNSLCEKIQCPFEKLGFLQNLQTVNKEAYKNHLKQWVESQKGVDWSEAVNKAIQDCVDKDIRQYLNNPCKAYDVFTCTTIAMLKKCPKEAWKC